MRALFAMAEVPPEPKAWWCKRKSKSVRRIRERKLDIARQIRAELGLPDDRRLA